MEWNYLVWIRNHQFVSWESKINCLEGKKNASANCNAQSLLFLQSGPHILINARKKKCLNPCCKLNKQLTLEPLSKLPYAPYPLRFITFLSPSFTRMQVYSALLDNTLLPVFIREELYNCFNSLCLLRLYTGHIAFYLNAIHGKARSWKILWKEYEWPYTTKTQTTLQGSQIIFFCFLQVVFAKFCSHALWWPYYSTHPHPAGIITRGPSLAPFLFIYFPSIAFACLYIAIEKQPPTTLSKQPTSKKPASQPQPASKKPGASRGRN